MKACVLGLIAVLMGTSALAQEAGEASAPQADEIRVEMLDSALEKTAQDPVYAWRLPKMADEAKEDTNGFWFSVGEMLKKVGRWIEEFLSKLQFNQDMSGNGDKGTVLPDVVKGMIYVLLALSIGGFAYVMVKHYFVGRRREKVEEVESAEAVLDLEDEHLSADRLQSQEWSDVAEQLLNEGKFRSALRALFLGILAEFGHRNLIHLHAAKSNRDYIYELGRRRRLGKRFREIFAENVRLFEGAWYGDHVVDRATVDVFLKNRDLLAGNPQLAESKPDQTPDGPF